MDSELTLTVNSGSINLMWILYLLRLKNSESVSGHGNRLEMKDRLELLMYLYTSEKHGSSDIKFFQSAKEILKTRFIDYSVKCFRIEMI